MKDIVDVGVCMIGSFIIFFFLRYSYFVIKRAVPRLSKVILLLLPIKSSYSQWNLNLGNKLVANGKIMALWCYIKVTDKNMIFEKL